MFLFFEYASGIKSMTAIINPNMAEVTIGQKRLTWFFDIDLINRIEEGATTQDIA